jgi:predicted HTH domain antitoxin
MTMTITFEVPDQIAAALELPPEQVASETRIAAAIFWYSKTRLSQGTAAAFAGMTRIQFLETLAAREVDVFQVDFDDLDREIERGRAAHRGRIAGYLPESSGLAGSLADRELASDPARTSG